MARIKSKKSATLSMVCLLSEEKAVVMGMGMAMDMPMDTVTVMATDTDMATDMGMGIPATTTKMKYAEEELRTTPWAGLA